MSTMVSGSADQQSGEVPTRLGPTAEEQAREEWSPEALARAVDAFSRHGFLEIPDAIPRDLIKSLAEAYGSRYGRTASELSATSLRVGHRRYQVSVALEPPFDNPWVYANPFAVPVIDALLGGQAVIVSAGGVTALPGAADQHIHRDHPELFHEMPMSYLLPRFAATMFVPLVDLDPDTVGTTGVWLGSHREDPSRVALPTSYASAHLPRPRQGSIYLADYRVVHGGTANQSDHERPVLYFLYGRPWFIDAVHYGHQDALRMSPDRLEMVPPQHRRLFSHLRPAWGPWAVSPTSRDDD